MQVDPRGPRFGASVTTVVLVVVLVTGSWALLAAQAVVFAIATSLGLRYAPYGLVFKVLVRPRLAPPRELEDEAAPRFAQGVGFAFALLGTVGYATGTTWLGIGATALALAAAFLNAAFGFCLGCEMYPLFRRITAKVRSEGKVPA
ncbi:hypothetical protein BKA00_006474 [Actinomadura coerulea]|uniref:DUF4395 domain-containing protein n=1 Tax=Actinomadura coerulea TaxID=46159 RepID=A0A7X0G4Y8_9ACTN|nr:DUF4395 domain-containing protein [Actinomadura coerulea]MBB6399560.1 hypothetical protein [Actinomadura coerulea]GGQ12874.1 membrane protein [Actinomadura coerulea]